MQKNSKYLELSLNNKWISLTKLWLSDNAPCSREKMFLELCPILPKAVRLHGRSITPADVLVVEAFRRIFGTSNIPEIIDKPPGENPGKLRPMLIIRRMLFENDTVTSKSLIDLNIDASLIANLAREGECIRVAKGIYQKTKFLKYSIDEALVVTNEQAEKFNS